MHHAPTILLVDDHAPTREAYAAFLLDDGFDVLQAGHGGEAFLLLSARRADLVVLDFPGTAVPILAVSAVDSRIQQERMRELCDDVLLKPCDPQVLRRAHTHAARVTLSAPARTTRREPGSALRPRPAAR